MLFLYFFEFEMKSEENPLKNELLEWIYLIICQIFNRNISPFLFFLEIFSHEKNMQKNEKKPRNFKKIHHKFFVLIYHISEKIIENREQNCLIKEINDNLEKNTELNEFLGGKNDKFGSFLIKTKDLIVLIEYFNEINKNFLKNFEKNPEIPEKNKEFLSEDLNLLNILLKVRKKPDFSLINYRRFSRLSAILAITHQKSSEFSSKITCFLTVYYC